MTSWSRASGAVPAAAPRRSPPPAARPAPADTDSVAARLCAQWRLSAWLDSARQARTQMPTARPDTSAFRTPVLRPDPRGYAMPQLRVGPTPLASDSLLWRRPGLPDTLVRCPRVR